MRSAWKVAQSFRNARAASTARPWSTPLARTIAEVIKTKGPISLKDYMQQCLTAADHGYYTRKPNSKDQVDQFGTRGDFVTSPEISQIFGELVGIWTVAEWMTQGQPSTVHLIEAGPGRGTLMDDVLRSVCKFPDFRAALSQVQLIEASQPLQQTQRRLLCTELDSNKTRHGIPISWSEHLHSIPHNPSVATFIYAHEFFDALPIHAFQSVAPAPSSLQTPTGRIHFNAQQPQWRELMVVPAAPKPNNPDFQLSLSKAATPHSVLLPNLSDRYKAVLPTPGSTIEISEEALSYAADFARRIGHENPKGGALIMDYGPAHTIPSASLRGIRAHQHVSPFSSPGLIDLSADVDFVGLAESACKASARVEVHGPVEQGSWLKAMGIQTRTEIICRNLQAKGDFEGPERIRAAVERLVERGGGAMGKIYKVLAIVPERSGQPPAGFG